MILLGYASALVTMITTIVGFLVVFAVTILSAPIDAGVCLFLRRAKAVRRN